MASTSASVGSSPLVSFAALLLGCSYTPPGPPPVPDYSDRCGALSQGCPGAEGDDGCPDLMIDLAQGCTSERTRASLRDVAEQMKADDRFKHVLVKGDPYLAECVAGAVRGLGVDESRIEAQNDKTPYVSFEVTWWDRAACR